MKLNLHEMSLVIEALEELRGDTIPADGCSFTLNKRKDIEALLPILRKEELKLRQEVRAKQRESQFMKG